MKRRLWAAVTGVGAAVAVSGMALEARSAIDLKQGWGQPEIARWYGGYQGSRLIPETWLRALEQPGSTALFLDPAHIASYRYLTEGVSQLPVGFAIDIQDDRRLSFSKLRWKPGQGNKEPWVGMTCAACHTAELHADGEVMRVEGGPTLGDFQGLLQAFTKAMVETNSDSAKFRRFADRVLGRQASEKNRRDLQTAFASLTAWQVRVSSTYQTDIKYGFGRLDAVGHILNKVAIVADPRTTTYNPPDAPVSYPFLWNTSQQTKVQWNGVATNLPINGVQTYDVGALTRNIGEVVGVFADVRPPSGWNFTYRSSVQIKNLVSIEQQLMSLKPPAWPRDRFPVNWGAAQRGKTLFGEHCLSCHQPLPRDDVKTRTRAGGRTLEEMSFFAPQLKEETKIDTDRWMACNSALNQASTGLLRGRAKSPLGVGDKFGATAPNAEILKSVITGVILENGPTVAAAGFDSLRGAHPPIRVNPKTIPIPGLPPEEAAVPDPYAQRRAACEAYARGANYKDLAYKGRPLTGVWATAPYLHNGSVPTLYDLLLPPARRTATFYLGTREYDMRRLGFVTEQRADNPFEFRTRKASGAVIEGNSNLGHDYGTTDLDKGTNRADLLEYMKLIGEF